MSANESADPPSFRDTDESGPPSALSPSTVERIGRYLVLHRLGEGGMGVVFAAYDPELDRKVAIKLISSRARDPQSKQRLQREAQAMARLSHPNVVAIYDVGTVGEQVYLAMELVEGKNLRQWLKEAPHTRAEILDAFLMAGRGLAAAHAAGMVHRDFKPDNVLVGVDGRVRVTDFGLARAVSPGGETDTAQNPLLSPDFALERAATPDPLAQTAVETGGPSRKPPTSQRLGVTLTHAGDLVGTPYYMAPEQYPGSGHRIDQRADQFALCVALFEALYGKHPFAEGGIQPMQPPGRTARVPAWLHHVLVRGLSRDPDDRYPTTDALLQALGRDPYRTVWRTTLGVLLIGLCVFGILTAQRLRDRNNALCQGAEAPLAEVYGAPHRKAIRAALLSSGKSYAADVWTRVAAALDQYTAGWAAMRLEACRDTHVRGVQSQALLDLRMECLDRRLQDVGALTALLSKPDGAVLENAVRASLALPPLSTCADRRALQAPVRPPEDPAIRAQVSALYQKLAVLKAAQQAGHYLQVQEEARQAVATSEQIGYQPILAEMLLLLGDTQQQAADSRGAEQTLFKAAVAGVAGRHQQVVAQAWTLLALVVGSQEGLPEQGLMWGRLARAAIDAVGGDERTKAQLSNSLGNIHSEQKRYEEALADFGEAQALHRRLLGPDSLEFADDLSDAGLALRYQGQKLDEALALHRQALAIYERGLGPQHPAIGTLLRNIALDLKYQGKYDEAVTYLKRAVEVSRNALGDGNAMTQMARTSLALVYDLQGRYADEQRTYEQILAEWRKQPGKEEARAAALYALGASLGKQGDHGEALARHQEALAIRQDHGSEDLLSASLAAVGDELVALGKIKEAVAPLKQALELRLSPKTDPMLRARSSFSLAKILWETRGDRKQSLELAQRAFDAYLEAGDKADADRKEVEDWFTHTAHRPPHR